MKFKEVILPVILTLLLGACAGTANSSAALPTVVLGDNASTPAALQE
jgi:hypothetical protein